MTASTGKRRKKGSGSLHAGYLLLTKDGQQKFVHVRVAERALGKPLPPGAVVHHVNGARSDNRPSNLVICQSQAYHRVLHRRIAARAACGHAGWRKCWVCGRYDAPECLDISPNGQNISHRRCRQQWRRERLAERKARAAAA